MLTWAIFVFISTGSTTRRMPFASCLSFGFTEYDGSTWAPYSVDLMYDWIDLVIKILGILMLSIQQPDCGELFVSTYLFCKGDCAPSKERMCWLALAFFNRRDASLRSCWSCSSERSSSAMVHQALLKVSGLVFHMAEDFLLLQILRTPSISLSQS